MQSANLFASLSMIRLHFCHSSQPFHTFTLSNYQLAFHCLCLLVISTLDERTRQRTNSMQLIRSSSSIDRIHGRHGRQWLINFGHHQLSTTHLFSLSFAFIHTGSIVFHRSFSSLSFYFYCFSVLKSSFLSYLLSFFPFSLSFFSFIEFGLPVIWLTNILQKKT